MAASSRASSSSRPFAVRSASVASGRRATSMSVAYPAARRMRSRVSTRGIARPASYAARVACEVPALSASARKVSPASRRVRRRVRAASTTPVYLLVSDPIPPTVGAASARRRLGTDLQFLEGQVAVELRLLREAEHALPDDVALDLVGSAGDP